MNAAVPFVRRPIVWLIAAAWVLTVGVQQVGPAGALGHDALVGAGLAGAAVFVVVWQVHLVAVMLPSALPMITLFRRAAAGQARPHLVRSFFVAGYLAVWTAFGMAAFVGDAVLHRVLDSVPALATRPWLVAGAVVIAAGAFQLSGLKDACLRECRPPMAHLRRHYRRGSGAAFRLGAGQGLFCIGCCWALMLALFGLGMANVAWMAPLAALMVLEKVASWGDRLAVPSGAALLMAGSLLVANPW